MKPKTFFPIVCNDLQRFYFALTADDKEFLAGCGITINEPDDNQKDKE